MGMMKNRFNQYYFPRAVVFGVSTCLVLAMGVILVGADRSDFSASATPTEPAKADDSSLPPCCPVDDEAEPSDVDLNEVAPLAIERDTKSVELPPATTQPAERDTVTGAARAGQWIELDDRVAFDLDYEMTDQDGRAFGGIVYLYAVPQPTNVSVDHVGDGEFAA
jgi:hypothetical protein